MAAALFAGAASGGRGTGVIIYSTFLRWRLGMRTLRAAAAPAQISSFDLYKSVGTSLRRVATSFEQKLWPEFAGQPVLLSRLCSLPGVCDSVLSHSRQTAPLAICIYIVVASRQSCEIYC